MRHVSRELLGTFALIASALCAIVITGVVVKDRLTTEVARAPGGSPSRAIRSVANWRDYAGGGHRFGNAESRVTITEFSDFECPFCKAFETGALRVIRERYKADVSVVFRHWPLATHRLAYPAARAAECAGVQDRFEPFHDVLFARQDSLGILSFDDIAGRAGVPDIRKFRACISNHKLVPGIEADIAAVRNLGGHGTPTILVNDLMIPGAVSVSVLDSLVRLELAKTPVATRN